MALTATEGVLGAKLKTRWPGGWVKEEMAFRVAPMNDGDEDGGDRRTSLIGDGGDTVVEGVNAGDAYRVAYEKYLEDMKSHGGFTSMWCSNGCGASKNASFIRYEANARALREENDVFDLNEISMLKKFLSDTFRIKDLGNIGYLHRLEFQKVDTRVVIHQQNFIRELFNYVHLL
ncbi:hypothetical protein LXL04_025364 [Taraxacum kok-saghyz]